MRYLSSPYKRAQATLVSLDTILALSILATAVTLYPHNVLTPSLCAWVVVLIGLLFVVGAYDLSAQQNWVARLGRFGVSSSLSTLLIYPLLRGPDRQRLLLVIPLVLATATTLYVVRKLFAHQTFSSLSRRAAIVVATPAAANRLRECDELVRAQFSEVSLPPVDDLATAIPKLLEDGVDLIAFEDGPHLDDAMADQLLRAQVTGVTVVNFVDFYSAITGRLPLELVDKRWILSAGLKPHSRSVLSRLRRVANAIGATLLLILLSPLLLLVGMLILLESGLPVIFAQERLGQFRQPFTLFKFRSMVQDAEREGPRWAQPGDPRVTRLGQVMRRTRLDELPQLVNVIRGDMQLIGPRPIREHFADQLAARSPFYDLRFLYPPGLTGWPQVLGPYGTDFTEQLEKLEMDLHYFKNAGGADDLYVLLKTVQVVLGRRGI